MTFIFEIIFNNAVQQSVDFVDKSHFSIDEAQDFLGGVGLKIEIFPFIRDTGFLKNVVLQLFLLLDFLLVQIDIQFLFGNDHL